MPTQKRTRSPQYLSTQWSSKGEVNKRIKIPQPTKRPIRTRGRDVLRWAELQKSPWWFVLHRRGFRRPNVGADPLEARAIPKSELRGTLPERIVYKYLVVNMHMSPNSEFSFQSSMQGGRLQLGGIVVDFLFPLYMFVIQVDGPTHMDFTRQRKDSEQELLLAQMGYRTFRIAEQTVYDPIALEEWMRNTFNIATGRGASGYSASNFSVESGISAPSLTSGFDTDKLFSLLCTLELHVDNLYREMAL